MSLGMMIAILPRKAEIESLYANGVPVPLVDVQHEPLISCTRGLLKDGGDSFIDTVLLALERGESVPLDYDETVKVFDDLAFVTFNQGVASSHMWDNFVSANSYNPEKDILILVRF